MAHDNKRIVGKRILRRLLMCLSSRGSQGRAASHRRLPRRSSSPFSCVFLPRLAGRTPSRPFFSAAGAQGRGVAEGRLSAYQEQPGEEGHGGSTGVTSSTTMRPWLCVPRSTRSTRTSSMACPVGSIATKSQPGHGASAVRLRGVRQGGGSMGHEKKVRGADLERRRRAVETW